MPLTFPCVYSVLGRREWPAVPLHATSAAYSRTRRSRSPRLRIFETFLAACSGRRARRYGRPLIGTGRIRTSEDQTRLLKKSLAYGSVVSIQVQNTYYPVQNTTEPRLEAPERRSENSTREFFNTLRCSRKLQAALSACRLWSLQEGRWRASWINRR